MSVVAFQSGIDLSHLSAQEQMALQACVIQYRGGMQRVASEMYFVAEQVYQMKEILGDLFDKFALEELGVSERTARRYLQYRKVLAAHFADERGRINVANAMHLTGGAVALLTGDTDQEVIDEIRRLTGEGKTVDATTVKEILQAQSELRAQLASAEADADLARRQKEDLAEKRALDEARYRNEIERAQENLRRVTQQRDTLEEELQQAQSKSTAVDVKEVPVEVVPAGFATVEDAIADANKRLQALHEEEVKAKAALEDALKQSAQAREEAAAAIEGTRELTALRDQLESVLAKYPRALRAKIAAANDDAKQTLTALGKAMIRFGEELVEA